MEYDVVIIGGGPAGSTTAGVLKKYKPDSRVLVLEREVFPRPHVGESQLPPITQILEELGCWDKVEAAGFPIKIGALYRWGSTNDLWRFDFLIGQEFEGVSRPSKLEGQRRQTTFHVERSVFDEILLDHAACLGAEVCEGAKVTRIEKDGDTVTGLKVEGAKPEFVDADGMVRAKHYIDASGHIGFLRRAMGVEVEEPTSLKNIAVWQYWQCDDWRGMDGVGTGGIRVRVLSIGSGWIWFIPLTCDRVSVGFVTHAEHYKQSGMTPAELYEDAIRQEPHASELLKNAKREGGISSTKDWSFLAERMAGKNWMLVGESAGFADPILAGGMTLAMVGAKEAGYILTAMLKGEQDEAWLKKWYTEAQRKRIGQHINFADYWYSANAHFSDLKEHTTKIAAEAGLDLNPEEAFRWLGTGGFASDDLDAPVVGTYRLGAVKSAMQIMTGVPADWEINRHNVFTLNLEGAQVVYHPVCRGGKIEKIKCYQRGAHLLPLTGIFGGVYKVLCRETKAVGIMREFRQLGSGHSTEDAHNMLIGLLEALEGLVAEGWVKTSSVEGMPNFNVTLDQTSFSMDGRA
jgi:flavin-dependent dehydrogenase